MNSRDVLLQSIQRETNKNYTRIDSKRTRLPELKWPTASWSSTSITPKPKPPAKIFNPNINPTDIVDYVKKIDLNYNNRVEGILKRERKLFDDRLVVESIASEINIVERDVKVEKERSSTAIKTRVKKIKEPSQPITDVPIIPVTVKTDSSMVPNLNLDYSILKTYEKKLVQDMHYPFQDPLKGYNDLKARVLENEEQFSELDKFTRLVLEINRLEAVTSVQEVERAARKMARSTRALEKKSASKKKKKFKLPDVVKSVVAYPAESRTRTARKSQSKTRN